MQIKFKTSKGEILFVKPSEHGNISPNNPILEGFDFVNKLSPYASQISEEQAKELVDELYQRGTIDKKLYKNYNIECWSVYNDITALDSFKSILQHLGIDFDPIVLFKPNNCF